MGSGAQTPWRSGPRASPCPGRQGAPRSRKSPRGTQESLLGGLAPGGGLAEEGGGQRAALPVRTLPPEPEKRRPVLGKSPVGVRGCEVGALLSRPQGEDLLLTLILSASLGGLGRWAEGGQFSRAETFPKLVSQGKGCF